MSVIVRALVMIKKEAHKRINKIMTEPNFTKDTKITERVISLGRYYQFDLKNNTENRQLEYIYIYIYIYNGKKIIL